MNVKYAEKDVKTSMIIAVIYTSFKNSCEKNEKKSSLNGIRIHDLWDTGGLTYQLNLGLWD